MLGFACQLITLLVRALAPRLADASTQAQRQGGAGVQLQDRRGRARAPPPMSSSLLREEDNQELRSIFDAFDHNSDGLLDVDEVAAILHSFGKPMTEAEVSCPCAWPLDRHAVVLDMGARGGRCSTW